MKKFTLLLTCLIIAITSNSIGQNLSTLWYLPNINLYQAENLYKYEVLVIDPEILFTSSEQLDTIIARNPDINIWLYINTTEIFEPMWSDKPWSIKLLAELQTKKSWWLYQPDGKKLGAWTKMKTLDMRADCPEINGQRYWQWILAKYLELLKDKRISGCLVDNVWGDDRAGIEWLATYNGQKGLDLNGDKKPDTNWREINLAWTKGFHSFFTELRKAKGKNFSIIANPGNLSYPEVDGKQLEGFPYPHHHLKGGNDWDINMMIAAKYKFVIINPEVKDFLFGAVSAVMLDNSYLCVGQDKLYHDYYNLNLGKPIGKTMEISKDLWSRKFVKGTVFLNSKLKKAWVEYNDGSKREE